jgi:uncharacterized protein (TIGR02145 family)
MKKKTRNWFYPLLIIGVLLTFTNSCKKDKKDPIITWANPADISFGTLLNGTQLNATADVPGTFVYTPPIGTKLNEGANQDLKVDFTPTDVATFNAVSKTVKISVTHDSGSGGVSSAVFNPNLTYGTMTDQDGNVYKTITIGKQTWMAENLRTTKYRNGEAIPEIIDNTAWWINTGAYCNYKNTRNTDTIATYGRLYNWFAVTDSRNIAPPGWHVPTDADWTTLTTYLGGESVAGGKLKETGTTHWHSPNAGATNETGFTALPGGFRDGSIGTFDGIGYSPYWWSSTESDSYVAWVRYIFYDISDVGRGYLYENFGFSVRCIKDN